MVDKNKDKGEFDEGFDDDFADTNFDDISFEDTTDIDALGDEDAEYEGDDFESEEWGEGEENPKASGKKAKKQKSGGGGGLSFNAIVIIGAVVLGGGVLAFNIMRETGKAQSAKPAMFQSILGISGIMDGLLFGEKEETATTEDKPKDESQGFLNDPNMPIPATPQDTVPPQPTPIAPVDGTVAATEPLTPMPTPTGEPSAEAPRGPEDDLPLTENTLPAETVSTETTALAPSITEVPPADATATSGSAASAEDILKQAMANREQKQQEENADGQAPGMEVLKDKIEEKVVDAKEKTEEVVTDIKEDVKEIIEPEPAPMEDVTPEPEPIAETSAPTPMEGASVANNEEVAALSAKLDKLLKRMDQIESDIDAVKGTDTKALEKTVASLKKDIASIKDRPVSISSQVEEDGAETEEAPKPAPVKKKVSPKPVVVEDEAYSPSTPPVAQPAPKATPVPAKAPTQTAASSGRWELRAAQPGRAWVSKPGERDMQAVAVGENLAGIGRITAITYQNGRWTVAGTQGSIQQ